MCSWGTDVELELEIPAHLSHSGASYTRRVKIDACIAPIVRVLNDAGIKTIASCCGHSKGSGRIDLANGDILELRQIDETERCLCGRMYAIIGERRVCTGCQETK